MIGPLETAGFWNQVFAIVGCPIRVADNSYVTSELGALMARALWCMCNNKQWSDDMEITYDTWEPKKKEKKRCTTTTTAPTN